MSSLAEFPSSLYSVPGIGLEDCVPSDLVFTQDSRFWSTGGFELVAVGLGY